MSAIIKGLYMGAAWQAHIMNGMDGRFHARVVIGKMVRVTAQYFDFDECSKAAKLLAAQMVLEIRGGGGDGKNTAPA